MKSRVLMVLLATVILFGNAAVAQEPDRGNRDTLILLTSRPDVAGDDSTFVVEMWMYDDVDTLIGVSMGWNWENPGLTLDSFKASPAAASSFTTIMGYEEGFIDTSNYYHRAQFIGIWLLSGSMWMPSPVRQLAGTWYFTLTGWSAGSEIIVDTNIWSDGQDLGFNPPETSYVPIWFHDNTPIIVRDPSSTPGSDNSVLPKEYSLSQNYPNPFNPSTTIEFAMPAAGDYRLTIYNVIGQVVDEFSGKADAGMHEVVWDASNRASGVYFYRLNAGSFTETKKMLLVK